MNNVVNLFGNSQVFNDNDYGPADFDIAKADLVYYPDQYTELKSTKHVLYRTDTGAELGVHGSRYSSLYDLSYKRMIDNQRSIIARSDLNTSGITEDIQVSHNGAKCFVRHTLPNEFIKTPDGDNASLNFLTVSSLDGTMPFVCTVGANQWACMNGQIFVSKAASIYKSRHTKKLDIDQGAKLISKAVTILQSEAEIWKGWSNTKLNNQEAFLLFARAAGATAVFKRLEEYPDDNYARALLDGQVSKNSALMYMWDRWTKHYRGTLGHNQWSVYNVLTDWSTHAPAAGRQSQVNIASISYKRGEKVRETIINNFKDAA